MARELGVRYVLEGSVRKAGDRVRITAQLIDAASGAHYGRTSRWHLEDMFDLQDRVTASVVGAIAPKLEQAEIERAQAQADREPRRLRLLFARQAGTVHEWTRESHEGGASVCSTRRSNAIPVLRRNMAWRRFCAVGAQDKWLDERAAPREIAETARLARRAIELGKDDAVALCRGGDTCLLVNVVGDLDGGAGLLIDLALVLNPNLASRVVRQRLDQGLSPRRGGRCD